MRKLYIIKKLAVGLLCLFPLYSYGQGEANIWYFGEKAGVDFNSGSSVAITDGAIDTYEGVATISDPSGNLLFYTDGITVWNRNHTIMPNGTGLTGHFSSTQSGVIVPIPGNPNRYYIFSVDEIAESGGLAYSEVDMTLDGGLGDIIPSIKNVELINPSTEKVTAVRHANNRDIWVMGHPWNSNAFHAYLITSMGINTTPVITNIGSSHTGSIENTRGYMKFSSDGSKLALAIESLWSTNNRVELFDFNNSTGELTNFTPLTPVSGFYYYGVEFSPNNQLLYVASRFNSELYQYDLTSANIDASKQLVGQRSSLHGVLGALQLGPDEKIYVAQDGDTLLAVIENPDVVGIGCNFREDAVDLNSRTCQAGLPTFIQSFVSPTITITETICENENYPFAGMILNTSGTYTHTFTASTGVDSTVILNLIIKDTSHTQIQAAICQGQSYLFGSNTLNVSGNYTDIFTNSIGCDSIVTLNLIVNDTSHTQIQAAICQGQSYLFGTDTLNASGNYTDIFTNSIGCDSIVTLNLIIKDTSHTQIQAAICQGQSYLFGTNTLNVSGNYTDIFTNSIGCDSLVTLNLKVINYPIPLLATDTNFCPFTDNNLKCFSNKNLRTNTLNLAVGHHNEFDYLWSTGEKKNAIEIIEGGTYTVNITHQSIQDCGITYHFNVNELCNAIVCYPNAFLPEGDILVNRTFKGFTEGDLEDYELIIYNRWGSVIFYTRDIELGWDGNLKGEAMPSGIYPYKYSYSIEDTKHIGQGSVTLIR